MTSRSIGWGFAALNLFSALAQAGLALTEQSQSHIAISWVLCGANLVAVISIVRILLAKPRR